MAKILSIEVKADNTKEYLRKLDEAIDLALEECGSECERYAKMKCPTDTGLLKNSITYALNGQQAAISTYTADEPDGAGQIKSGGYSGTANKDKDPCVYIGTNVEYAAYVEMGSSHHPTPKPYLKPALEDHIEKYKDIFKKHISAIDN